jgi:peroxisomal 3,2-trans-enoyl-CoA isomerase
MPNGVSVEYNGRVAIITLDDQKKLNALSKDGFYQLAKYMREISTHDEVFVTLLIGRGRFFSA